jgi:hypothetical protein
METRRAVWVCVWMVCCGWLVVGGCEGGGQGAQGEGPLHGPAATPLADQAASAQSAQGSLGDQERGLGQAQAGDGSGAVGGAAAPAPVDVVALKVEGWSATLERGGEGGVQACTSAQPGGACRVLAQGEALREGETARVDEVSQAVLRLSDGGVVRLDSGAVVTLEQGAERTATLHSGRALFDLPDGLLPHARLRLPQGEVVFLGTEVLADVTLKAQWLTVLRGAVEVGGLEAKAGEEVQWLHGQGPQRAMSVDPAGDVDWAEERDASVGAIPRGLGSLFAQTPGGGTPRPLKAVERRVQVKVQGPMSYTEVTEVFENTSSDTMEGVYRFPLPADAQISRLALKVNGQWQEGVFVENRRAERIWQEVIDQWRDPAWLRWKQGEQFELRIFPIEGKSRREVKIGYTQPLKEAGGQRVYRYLMPADPGGVQPVGVFGFEAKVEGHDAQGGVVARGYEVEVKDGERQGQHVARFEGVDFRASGDLQLTMKVAGGGEGGGREAVEGVAFVDQPTKGRTPMYGLTAAVTLRPKWGVGGEALSGGRDIVIVVDSSFSRDGQAMKVQAAAVSRMITLMDGADRLQILACNATCQPIITRDWARPDAALSQQALTALSELPARATTNLLEGPRVAAALFSARDGKLSSRPARVILFSDGEASAGPQSPAALRDALGRVLLSVAPDARLTPVDLGGGGDPLALHALALGGHGKLITLDPSEAIGTAARRILAAQGPQLLSDISVTFPPGFEDVYPQTFMPLSPGEPLQVFARPPADAASSAGVHGDILLRGTLDGAPFEQRLPLSLHALPDPGLAWVPKLWAQARIQALELDDAERHRDALVRLSLHYGVLSRHTSLMALEDDAMRREFGLNRDASPTWTGDAPSATTSTDSSARGAGMGMGADNGARTGGGQGGASKKDMPSPPRDMSPPSDDVTASTSSRPSKSSAAPPKSSRAKGGVDFYTDIDGFGGANEKAAPGPGRMPAPKGRRRVNPSFIKDFKAADYGERIKQARAEVAKLPNDPKPLKKLIRLLGLAGFDADAAAEVAAWRAKNPRDVEALLLSAEVALRAGQPAEAALLIADAAEVGARSLWLQERLLHAYEANDQLALACHQRLSVLSLRPRKPKDAPLDPLTCPIASDLSWLPQPASPAPALAASPASPASPLTTPTPAPKNPQIRVSITWESGGDDLSVALVSADGRMIAWHGGLDSVHVSDARGFDVLSVKDLSDGAYTVEVLRDASSGSLLQRGTVTIELPEANIKKTIPFTTSGPRLSVASLRWTEYW